MTIFGLKRGGGAHPPITATKNKEQKQNKENKTIRQTNIN